MWRNKRTVNTLATQLVYLEVWVKVFSKTGLSPSSFPTDKAVPLLQLFFVRRYFLWDHLAHPGYFENRIPLKLVGVCSLANYSVAYEETNRVSDFRDFVCSLFQKAILLDFYK